MKSLTTTRVLNINCCIVTKCNTGMIGKKLLVIKLIILPTSANNGLGKENSLT